MAKRISIGLIHEYPEGEIRPAALPEGRALAVYNVGGTIYVTADRCTHGDASLSEEGSLCGNIVECPWHYGTFDVVTGSPTGLPCNVALQTYAVEQEGEQVYVLLDT